MDNQESQIEATPEGLSRLEARSHEIEDELAVIKERKAKLESELRKISTSIRDVRYEIDLLTDPDKLPDDVEKWQQKIEGVLASINLESVKRDPQVVVDFFNNRDEYRKEGRRLRGRSEKLGNNELKNAIIAILTKINEKAKEIYEDERYGKYLEGLTWARS